MSNEGLFITPGIYFNTEVDRICLLHAEVEFTGRKWEIRHWTHNSTFVRTGNHGIAPFMKEAASNGTKYLGLMGPRYGPFPVSPFLYGAPYDSTIPDNLGAWDSPPWSNTSLEEVLFFAKLDGLDVPKTRGTWRVDVPCNKLSPENLVYGGRALDVGKILQTVKEWIWLSAFDGRVVEYEPREGEKRWPNIRYCSISEC